MAIKLGMDIYDTFNHMPGNLRIFESLSVQIQGVRRSKWGNKRSYWNLFNAPEAKNNSNHRQN